jgi:hypothetical protein
MSGDLQPLQPSASRGGGRAAGCLSILLMLAASPISALGLLSYISAEQAGATHGGTAGGLAGLGSAVGIALMVIAASSFLIGAIVFARTGKE